MAEHGRVQGEQEPGRLLTARRVAERLCVSTETVLRWTRTGALRGFRMPGGALRYSADEIEDWLRAQATDTPGGSDTKGRPTSELSRKQERKARGGDHDAGDTARRGVQTQLW